MTVEAVTLSQFFSQEMEPTQQSHREQTLREVKEETFSMFRVHDHNQDNSVE